MQALGHLTVDQVEELRIQAHKFHGDRLLLRKLYQCFHQLFVSHLSSSLSEDIKQETVHLPVVQLGLKQIQIRAAAEMNPMGLPTHFERRGNVQSIGQGQ